MRDLDDVTGAIIHAALQVHRGLGPGLLESVYEAILGGLLSQQGLHVARQHSMPVDFAGMRFDEGFRVDLLVERCVIVELKSVQRLAPVHGKQLLTYLRLADLRVGLLINFGAGTFKEGLHRVVNDLPRSPASRLRVNQLTSAAGPAAAGP